MAQAAVQFDFAAIDDDDDDDDDEEDVAVAEVVAPAEELRPPQC